MIILGVNEGHNASAAILINGSVEACVSEERFSRIKNDYGYPARAIESVLAQTGVRPQEIDKVAVASKRLGPFAVKLKREALFTIQDYIEENHAYWKPLLYEGRETDFWQRMLENPKFIGRTTSYDVGFIKTLPKEQWADALNKERVRLLVEHLKIERNRITFVDHHVGHAYYAYYASQAKSARRGVVLTADSWGDGSNATISVVNDGELREIHRTAMCNLARMYSWTTLVLGMKPHEHEYKVMGLAPYAKAYIRDAAYKVFKETLVVDGLDFKWNKKPGDMYYYFRDKLEGIRFDGIAAGLQLWLEEMLAQWITNVMEHAQAEVLYFSGGLSMNVKANKMIGELPCVRHLYISPSGGDESLAMGAAFFVARSMGEAPVALKDAYLGYEPGVEDSMRAVAALRHSSEYRVIDGADDDTIAELLASGKVLGRCVGKMEFGARSLGNRAILCDASRYEQLRIINEKIKFRDFWMPFTPSILEERQDDYLVNPKGFGAEYMTLAFDSTLMARDHLKAAIHPYDFTVRPQLVSARTNPGYYALLKAFERQTGRGGLLNTSLNLHGIPIVCTVEEALQTLFNSGLDGMILPEVLVLKNE